MHFTEHLEEAQQIYPEKNRIFGLFVQGSQNYSLDYSKSDTDTKLLIVPSLEQIVKNKAATSYTYIRDNDEHIDIKDIRLYRECILKQNPNYMEIMFTPYKWINPLYQKEWEIIDNNKEAIVHINSFRALKAIKGMAYEKMAAMEHRYPSKVDLIDTYGYDGKQVSHIIRLYYLRKRYLEGYSYADCLNPYIKLLLNKDDAYVKMMEYKQQIPSLEVARQEAKEYLDKIVALADGYCQNHSEQICTDTLELVDQAIYDIIKKSIIEDLKK